MFSLGGPLPAIVGSSSDSTDLDEREQFPQLPSSTPMDSVAISQELKPLTVVVSPAQRGWLGKQPLGISSFGAGMLLQADEKGYLFATARHVVDTGKSGETKQALVATSSGVRRMSSLDTTTSIWFCCGSRDTPAAHPSPSRSPKGKMARRFTLSDTPKV
jgi:hypothetical protein